MFVRFLGLMDIYCAIIIALLHFNLHIGVFGIVAYFYLIGKFIIFPKDIISVIDGLTGLYIIIMTLGVTTRIDLFISIWLLQKGVFSFLKL